MDDGDVQWGNVHDYEELRTAVEEGRAAAAVFSFDDEGAYTLTYVTLAPVPEAQRLATAKAAGVTAFVTEVHKRLAHRLT